MQAAQEIAATVDAALDGVAAAIAAGTLPHVAVKGQGKIVGAQADVLRRYGFGSIADVQSALQAQALPLGTAAAAGVAGTGSRASALGASARAAGEAATAARVALDQSQRRWSDTLGRLDRDAASSSPAAALSITTAAPTPSTGSLAVADGSEAAASAELAIGAPLPRFLGVLLRCSVHPAGAAGQLVSSAAAACCSSVSAAPFDSEQWFCSSSMRSAAPLAFSSAPVGAAGGPASATKLTACAAALCSGHSVARSSTLFVFLRHAG